MLMCPYLVVSLQVPNKLLSYSRQNKFSQLLTKNRTGGFGNGQTTFLFNATCSPQILVDSVCKPCPPNSNSLDGISCVEDTPSPNTSNIQNIVAIIIGGVGGGVLLLVVIAIIVVVVVVRARKRHSRLSNFPLKVEEQKTEYRSINLELGSSLDFPKKATTQNGSVQQLETATLLHLIGEGNFGIDNLLTNFLASVYKGVWKSTTVALKKTNLNNIDESLQEANTLMQLQHPNIVQYLGLSKIKDTIYIVMEFCENGSLIEMLRTCKLKDGEKLSMFVVF
jgi:hypothetical protein